MSAQVEPLLKDRDECGCGCGCGCYGTLKRPWRSNGVRCVRGCGCKQCHGRSVKRRASERERRIARDLGGERSPLSGALNGADVTGPVDVEETSDKAVCRGFVAWVGGKGVQAKTARLLARRTDAPRALLLSPGGRPSWAVMPYEDFVQLARGRR